MGSIPTRSRHPGRRCPAALRIGGVLLGLLLAVATGLEGQEADTVPPPPDRAGAGAARADTTPGPPVSPLGALGRSILIPGWGQAAVDRPIRGAFYFVAEAASVWMILKSQSKLASAKRAREDGGSDGESPLLRSRGSQRENWIVLGVFTALVSGVDAWVSAHLYGFEGELTPPENGGPGAEVTFRVPLELP